MISEKLVLELIALGNENRNLDYKGAFSWSTASGDQKHLLVKDILSFANTRDGGRLLIGVNDKTGEVEGLDEEQYASFDQTSLNDIVHNFSDPPHTASVHRLLLDGVRVVVIDIPEFADVPILCAKEIQSCHDPKKLILRKAGLYKRTGKATSELISSKEEMRELLNRALLRRQDELFGAIKQIVSPNQPIVSPPDTSQFRAEVDGSERYFKDLGQWARNDSPHWIVRMQPETYIKERIQYADELQNGVQNSAVSLRGWTFPFAGRADSSEWINFDGGSQSVYSRVGDRPEAIRAHKSGLIMWCAALGEDYWDLASENTLSILATVFSVTEWVIFAKRFFEPLLSVDDVVFLRVQLHGAAGRKLVSRDPSILFSGEYIAICPSISVEEIVTLTELRADAEFIARKIVRKILELFNWSDSSGRLLSEWQQELHRRRFNLT